MSLIYKNITGSTAVTLIDSYTDGDISQKLDSINLCNVHDTDSVTVDLYYSYTIYASQLSTDWNTTPVIAVDTNGVQGIFIYYLIKNVIIPKGTTLNLDDISFNNKIYLLAIKLNASDSAVDVIIDAEIKGTTETIVTAVASNIDSY
tara:strand:- start:49 stop:489 length:441 start_codon:yes stop_codon:yes gene_type:complete